HRGAVWIAVSVTTVGFDPRSPWGPRGVRTTRVVPPSRHTPWTGVTRSCGVGVRLSPIPSRFPSQDGERAANKMVILLPGFQGKGDGVDAVARVRRGAVSFPVEDVAQVRVTTGTAHFGADHTQRGVLVQGDRLGVGGIEEAGPSAVGVELGVGTEQFGPATAASIYALGGGVHVGTAPGALGRGLTQNRELVGSEAGTPLLVISGKSFVLVGVLR